MSYDTQADYITIKIGIISLWPVRHLTFAPVILSCSVSHYCTCCILLITPVCYVIYSFVLLFPISFVVVEN